MKDNTNFYDDLESFVTFEEETAIIYPWAMDKQHIMAHAIWIGKECNSCSDTETLYSAINKICGINPVLTLDKNRF